MSSTLAPTFRPHATAGLYPGVKRWHHRWRVRVSLPLIGLRGRWVMIATCSTEWEAGVLARRVREMKRQGKFTGCRTAADVRRVVMSTM